MDDFVITPGVSRVLTPEENLTSQVVFDFSQPIFSEYETQDEESMKKIHAALQKKISISPNVDIAASSFHITPQRIEITGVFQEGQEYRIHLTDIEDIYGHVASSVLKFTPENDAFLAVRMLPDTTEFLSGQPISARIYAVSPKKEAYTMKLCRLDVSGFVSVQKIVSQNSADTIKGIYDIMNSPHSSGCVKKDISLNQNDMMTDFSVSEMMDGGVLPE